MDAADMDPKLCYQNPTPEVLKTLQTLITDELRDSRYYEALSKRVRDPKTSRMFMQFSRDELRHARRFSAAYYIMTKTPYFPQMETPIIPPYREALRERYLAESRDVIKYGRLAAETDDPCLKQLYMQARDDEAMHAREIFELLQEADTIKY
jgi:rubrerythrin